MSTIYLQEGQRHVTHATVYRFTRAAQREVIGRFKQTPNCNLARCTYDPTSDTFEIDCNADNEDLCIRTIIELTEYATKNVPRGSASAGTSTIFKIPAASVVDNSLDEIEEGAYEDDEDEEVEYDEDSEEESQQPPASTSATATATITASQTGPRDLSSALRELNVRESYWRPQLAHTNIRDVANADTLRELSGGINCDLVLQLQDNRVLIKPRDPDDEAAISEARERLTTVEADMNPRIPIDHLLKLKLDESEHQLRIEQLKHCTDESLSRVIVPPSWWPSDSHTTPKYMAEAGVLRCEVYDSTDARWNVLPVKGRRLPVPASYDLESDFTTSLRKLESEVVLDDPASRPTEGGSETLRLPPGRDKTIGKWINSVRSGSPHLTATSGSEDLVSLASATTQRTSTAASAASAAPVSHVIPSQANGSPHVESKQVKCGQSHALSPTRTPAERHEHPRTARPASTKSSQDRIEDNKLFLESFRPPSNVPQHRPQPHGQPPKSQKASEASVTVAPASQPKPKPPQPAASKAQAGAGINRFTLIDLPDEDTESSSTGPSSVPPPGYEITGADENNVPTQQSDSHLNSQRSLLDDDDDMRRDTENTGFTEVSRQKKASNTRSSTSKPASRRVMVKGKGGLVERLADDDTEPRRVYWNTKHRKPGPAKGKSSKQTTTASATLKNLKAGFELPTAPPSNTSTPQKANTVTEPQTRPPAPQPCSSKLLACIKSSLEDARMHRGLVESRFELGKVLMHNDRSIEEGANWDQIKTDILERSNGFKANYGAFSPAITSRVRDITALLAHFKISEVVSEQAQWHLTCSTTDQKEMNLIVDARNTQAEPYISNERILGATYMHHPQRAHDARWVMRGACRRNIESIEGASDLFSTLQTPEWTSPSSDSSADITYPALHGRDTPALFVHATQLHVTKRYLTDTHNPNQHLQITRIIEMLISRGNPSYGGDANRFQTHCQPYETLVAPEAESPLWYELSLHDERFDIIADNSTLSLGQRAAWSVEERLTDEIKAGLGALEALSGRFVEVMDGVGHENRGMGWVINRSIKEKRVKRDAEKAGKILNAPAVDGLW